ncbi:MAG: O-antigen ligase family protein [Candidatus Andeanibacterium colombiense]|uniref:O-antigen ligase family protein n=1 Tax=Candidatus Andeanibacterium colombiense TaxID=3121345 RepID=A0AAJ5X4Q3_9SPHN|nr:MAG: O-antigen ligase family protein [Sphingomonadaceae bacterium]
MIRLPLFDSARRHAAIAAVLLILALALGGGGSPSPDSELAIELLAGVAALAWLWQRGAIRVPTDGKLWLVAAAVVLLPLIQLIPLPPSIWHALPGRATEVAALRLVGAENSWQPLTTSLPRTLASLLAVMPPVILLLMTGALRPSERRWLVAATVAMVLLSALIGAMQLGGGESGPRFYDQSPPSLVLGFQANRNSTADVMLIGLLALAAFWAGRDRTPKRPPSLAANAGLAGAAAALIALACILTSSRAGLLLLLPTLAAAWALVADTEQRPWQRFLPAIAAAGFVMAIGALLLGHNPAIERVAARFSMTDPPRELLWDRTVYAIGQYWPVGSGMGTFVPSYLAFEPLEDLDPSVPNRAHNDFLELTLEAGVLGLALLALTAALVGWMAYRAWRDRPEDRGQVGFGFAALGIIALHSLADYPMRSISLASLAAVAAGMLAAPPRPRREQDHVKA